MNAHEFALFYPQLTQHFLQNKDQFTITDLHLVHRMGQVLRLKPEETIILFDQKQQGRFLITSISKKSVVVSCLHKQNHQIQKPLLYVLLSLLKREALDQALYSCAQFGVAGIQLIATEKGARHTLKKEEIERLQRVMQAACEQSKQFCVPEFLHNGQVFSFQDFFSSDLWQKTLSLSYKCVADVKGQRCRELFSDWEKRDSFVLTVGPEGDFTDQEKQLLEKQQFNRCFLGNTVLRSEQALSLSIALVRIIAD